MEGFNVTLLDANDERVASSFGVSEERHNELAHFSANIMDQHLRSKTSLSSCLKQVTDFAVNPNEVVYFNYVFLESLNTIKQDMQRTLMKKLLGNGLGQ